MYNRTLLSKFLSFQGRSILRLQRATFSSQNDSKIALRRDQYNLHRFSLPTDSDSFFVDRSRLTSGESFYQKFSSGLSVISIIALLSFPLVLFLYLDKKHKSISHIKLTNTSKINSNINSKLRIPILNNSKSLVNLLDSKIPVIIFYFIETNEEHNSLLIKLTRLILEEIKEIYKNDLNIVCVDVNNFKGPISPSLKSELSTCGSFLYHLLIPSQNEPMLTTLSPLITVESFMDQIIRILDPLGFKLNSYSNSNLDSNLNLNSNSNTNTNTNFISNIKLKNNDSIKTKLLKSESNKMIQNKNSSKINLEELDNRLSSLRNCLFELDLNNRKPGTLIDQHSLESMLKECKRINHL